MAIQKSNPMDHHWGQSMRGITFSIPKAPILGSQDIVSGDYGRVSLNAYAYDQAGNKGVSYGLNNIMLLSKGDSLGGAKPSAASDFGVVAGKGSAPVAESVDSDW
jgi:hypothetical protein